jgi:hypothetical protein
MSDKKSLRQPNSEDTTGVLPKLIDKEVRGERNSSGRRSDYLDEADEAKKLDPKASRLDAAEAEMHTNVDKPKQK